MQVRNVELLVNGVVVRNDVSFPFDFFAVAPGISPGVRRSRCKCGRRTPAGNVGLSDVLTYDLVNDAFAPTLTSFDPPGGSSRTEGLQTVHVRFSKPMEAASATAETSASATRQATSSRRPPSTP